MSEPWNPWHGCVRISEGCVNCYVYRIDGKLERNAGEVRLNSTYDLPVRRTKNGYKIKPGEQVYTCFSSDFFLDAADEWRPGAWDMIRRRPDLGFIIITKRISRFGVALPDDWGDGYDNVSVGCTCENQRRADERMPLFLSAPIKHKFVVCEPLLGRVDLSPYLCREIESVSVGGESGEGARVCDYDWVLTLRDNCIAAGVPFRFRQTGASFRKDGRLYSVPRSEQHRQAEKAEIDFM